MQTTQIQTVQLPNLFHLQTQTYIKFPSNISIIYIGKSNHRVPPDIDISTLPNSGVVSRVHALIQLEENNYFIEDVGSSNGTYLNHSRLMPLTRYSLKLGDRIDFCKGNKVTFLFQLSNTTPATSRKAEDNDGKEQVSLFTKCIGLALMLGGIGFLSSSVILGIFTVMYSPALGSFLVVIAGVLTLTYGRANRNLGWILITLGVVMAFFSDGIVLQSMTLLSFMLAFVALSAGYDLFTCGKVLNYNFLSLKRILKN